MQVGYKRHISRNAWKSEPTRIQPKRYGPKILVVGCGYLGMTLARHFHIGGYEVHGLTQSARLYAMNKFRPFPVETCDTASRKSLNEYRDQFQCMVICSDELGGEYESLESQHVEATRNLIDAVRPAKTLIVSSTSVYGNAHGNWVDESTPVAPSSERDRFLSLAENLVLRTGGLVARLGQVYGPGRFPHLQKVLEGAAVIEDGGGPFINSIHRDDAAGALFMLIAWHAVPGVYNVVDDHPVRLRDMLEWLAGTFGRSRPRHVASENSYRQDRANCRIRNTRLHALGWKCRHPSFHAAAADIVPTLVSVRNVCHPAHAAA